MKKTVENKTQMGGGVLNSNFRITSFSCVKIKNTRDKTLVFFVGEIA